MDSIQSETLSRLATTNTLRLLIRYGSIPTIAHATAIHTIIRGMTASLTTRQRIAYPLFCGGGKSTAILGFIMALNRLNLEHSIVVSAGYVESLISLKLALIAQGVSESKVGLIHSKNDASLPSDDKEEAYAKLFVLVTHANIKYNRSELEGYHFYNGRKRDLVIWDESLLIGHSKNISVGSTLGNLGKVIGEYESINALGRASDSLTQVVNHLLSLKGSLLNAQVRSKEEKDFPIEFPSLSDNLTLDSLYQLPMKDRDTINNVIEFVKDTTILDNTLFTQEENGNIISFNQTIPDELDNIVVLDASHMLRHLTQSDKSVTSIDLGVTKSYENLTINYFKNPAGRKSLEDAFHWKKSKKEGCNLVKELVNIIANILIDNPNDSIIVWTYKKRGDVDIPKILLSELINNYPDLELKTRSRLGDYQNISKKDRLNFMTFGNELGINSLSHCKYSVFCGLLYKPDSILVSDLKGLSGNLGRDVYSDNLLYQTQISEQCHLLYQAISRGSSRNTVEGKGEKHTVYFFHQDIKGIKRTLDTVFPKAKWIPYKAEYIEDADTLAFSLACNVSEKLESLTKEEFEALNPNVRGEAKYNKVSSKALKVIYYPTVSTQFWNNSLRDFNNDFSDTFKVVGRSFERVEHFAI